MFAPWVSLRAAAAEMRIPEAWLRLWTDRSAGVWIERRAGVDGLLEHDLADVLAQEAERRAALAAHEEEHL